MKIDATTSEFNMTNFSQGITTNQFQRQLRVSSSKQTLLRISQSFKEKHSLELELILLKYHFIKGVLSGLREFVN